jgi:hypothetical protein
MIIPIDIGPKIHYQMPGQVDEEGNDVRGVNATLNPALRSLAAEAQTQQEPPRAGKVNDPTLDFLMDAPARALPLPESRTAATATPPPDAPPASAQPSPAPAPSLSPEKQADTPPAPTPSSPAVESVVRMLFGNPAPAPQ